MKKKDRNVENWYFEALKHAQKTVYISSAYFIPNDDVKQALIDCAKRGVDVRVFTNADDTTDLPLITKAGRYHFNELLEAGVRLYEFRKGDASMYTTLHTKGAVIDGEISTVGSHNLDDRSFIQNSENTIVVHDKEFGRQMHGLFKKDLEMSQEITMADLERECPATNVEQWMCEKILRRQL